MFNIDNLDLPVPDGDTRFSCASAARLFRISKMTGGSYESWPPRPDVRTRLVKECSTLKVSIQITDSGDLYVTGPPSGTGDHTVALRFGHWNDAPELKD